MKHNIQLGVWIGIFLITNVTLGQTHKVFQPIDYWQFNSPTNRTANSMTALPNGGALTICKDCFAKTNPNPATVWINFGNSTGINKGQLHFPLGSKKEEVYVMESEGQFAKNNPWMKTRTATLEFVMKPFGLQRALLIQTPFGQFVWGHAGMSMSVDMGKTTAVGKAPFNNVEKLAPHYYYPTPTALTPNSPTSNTNWHHIVVTIQTFDATKAAPKKPVDVAEVCFYVDGQKVVTDRVQTEVPTDGFFSESQLGVGSKQSILIGGSLDPNTEIGKQYPDAYFFEGILDEIALYTQAIPASLVYQHCAAVLTYQPTQRTHALNPSGSYNFKDDQRSLVADFEPSTLWDDKDALPLEVAEAPTILSQIPQIPLPRYKPGHTLLRNAHISKWGTDKYMHAKGMYFPSPENMGGLNIELGKKWNYYLIANASFSPSDFKDVLRTQANQNPDIPLAYGFYSTIYNPAANKKGCLVTYDTTDQKSLLFVNGKYFKAQGQPQYKPMGSTKDFIALGNKVKFYMEGYWEGKKLEGCEYTGASKPFNRPFDLVIDDDEHMMLTNLSSYYNRWVGVKSMGADPSVVKDFESWVTTQPAGQKNWYHYEAERKFLHHKLPYKEAIMKSGRLNGPIGPNTKFTAYQFGLYWDYTVARNYMSSFNGNRYASHSNYTGSPDMYVRWAFATPRVLLREAIMAGDKYLAQWYAFSSYKSEFGWSWAKVNTHDDLVEFDKASTRPATALGFTKYMAVLGTEFSYLYYGRPGCDGVNYSNCADNPNALLWQYFIPAYAQAITSRYEDLLRNGTVMEGDKQYPTSGWGANLINKNIVGLNPEGAGLPTTEAVDYHTQYTFDTHDNRIIVGARKSQNGKKYVIATSIFNYGNNVRKDNMGNVTERNAPLEETTVFQLEKDMRLKINTRRQGSVYILDKSDPNRWAFYQLDKWHQPEHPYYWSKNFYFEAEVFDNQNEVFQVQSDAPAISTEGSATLYDLTQVKAGIRFATWDEKTAQWKPTSAAAEYQFEPRSEQANAVMKYGIAIRAQKLPAAQGKITLQVWIDQNPTPIATLEVKGKDWEWYEAGNVLDVSANQVHVLKVKAVGANVNQVAECIIDEIRLMDYNDIAVAKAAVPSCLRYTLDATVEDAPQNISYRWDFGDGGTATGAKVSHDFTSVQTFDVSCTLTFPDGKKVVKKTNISTPFPDFDFQATKVEGCSTYLFTPVFQCMQPQKYQWDFDNPSNDKGAKDPAYVRNDAASGNVNVLISDEIPAFEGAKTRFKHNKSYNPKAVYHTFNGTPREFYVKLTVNPHLPVDNPARKTVCKVVKIEKNPNGSCPEVEKP